MRKMIFTLSALLISFPAFGQAPGTEIPAKAVKAAPVAKAAVPAPVTRAVLPRKAMVAPALPTIAVPPTAPVVAPAAAVPANITVVPPAVTAAPVAPEMPWWKVLLRYGLELVFTILGILATGFVTVLMRKYGFEMYSEKVNDILQKGIGFAEQKSAQALKINGKPLDGAEKLALALEFIGEKAKEYKIPDKGKAYWEKKVESWLGVQKLETPK